MSDDRFLHELDLEVEADLELNAEGTIDPDDLGSPAGWLVDPVEVQEESIELRSLHGAIEALESDSGPGPSVSSA
jgi:hypothetical protein